MTNDQIDALTRRAVSAALAEIDSETCNETKRSAGPCGDALASNLHRVIEQALIDMEAHKAAVRGMIAAKSI